MTKEKSIAPVTTHAAADPAQAAVAQRSELVRLAARLSACSGEHPLVVAEKFAVWLDAQANRSAAVIAALNAACIEASDRHEHLRGRHPNGSDGVIARATLFVNFIIEGGA